MRIRARLYHKSGPDHAPSDGGSLQAVFTGHDGTDPDLVRGMHADQALEGHIQRRGKPKQNFQGRIRVPQFQGSQVPLGNMGPIGEFFPREARNSTNDADALPKPPTVIHRLALHCR